MNISKRELSSLVDSLRDFLKTFDKPSNCLQIPLPEPKIAIGTTKSKDNVCTHYYNDIIEDPLGQICLSFRFGNNNSCVCPIKKFELHGNQFTPTETVNFNHREIHQHYKNRCYVAMKCGLIESNCDVWCIHTRFSV